MATSIGTIVANLQLNIENFKANMREARESLGETANNLPDFSDMDKKLTSVGKTITMGVTAPLAGMAAAAVKTTSDFDTSMSKVQAISGATGEDLQKLRDKAKEMGSTTQFSASEAADALGYMAMAGWDTEKMLGGLDGVMALAAADGADLATVSDIVTDAMTAFGMEASQAGEFADVLAAASSSANTNVTMLGESFKYVAPVAGALGFSVQDTSVALGLMANAGIKGSQAGTALRGAMSRLAAPTDAVAKLMDQYNISIKNSDGSVKSLQEIMGILRDRLGGLDEATQAQVATTLFGQEAMSGMLSIVNASTGDYEKLTNAINNSEGVAKNMAETTQDNLGGAIKSLLSALEGLAISFGEMLIPSIRACAEKIKGFVNWLNSLDQGTKTVILGFGLFVAAIGPVLLGVGKAITLFKTLKSTYATVKASLALLSNMHLLAAAKAKILAVAQGALNLVMTMNPIGLVVMAIAGLIAAFAALWVKCEGFRNFWIGLWDGIKTAFSSFIEGFKTMWSEGWENLKRDTVEGWNSIKQSFSETFTELGNKISESWTNFKTTISTKTNEIKDATVERWEAIKQFHIDAFNNIRENIVNAWNGFKEIISNGCEAIRTWIVEKWTAIVEFHKNAFLNIWQMVSNTWSTITTFISDKCTQIKDFIVQIWEGIKEFLSQTWEYLTQLVTTTWEGIKNIFITIWQSISDFIVNIWNNLSAFLQGIWTSIGNAISTAWNGFKNTISSILTGIKDFIVNTWNTITNWLWQLPQKLFNIGSDMFNKMKSGIMNTVGGVYTAVTEGVGKAITWLKDLPRQALTWGRHMIEGFIQGIKGAVGGLINTVKGVGQGIRNFIGFSIPKKGPLHVYMEWMPHMIQGLTASLESNKHLLLDAAKGVAGDLSQAMSTDVGLAVSSNGTISADTSSFRSTTTDYSSSINQLLTEFKRFNDRESVYNINIDNVSANDSNDIRKLAEELEAFKNKNRRY